MKTNVFAFTENHSNYPGYVSLNREPVVGGYSIVVRSPGNHGESVAALNLPTEQLELLRQALEVELPKASTSPLVTQEQRDAIKQSIAGLAFVCAIKDTGQLVDAVITELEKQRNSNDSR